MDLGLPAGRLLQYLQRQCAGVCNEAASHFLSSGVGVTFASLDYDLGADADCIVDSGIWTICHVRLCMRYSCVVFPFPCSVHVGCGRAVS